MMKYFYVIWIAILISLKVPGQVSEFENHLLHWWVPVKGYQQVKPREHPRLLFRKSDIPALLEKANTPEGQAIIKRLRYLLDGGNGDRLATLFNPATGAYTLGKNHSLVIDTAGVYTFSHVAGYGLLYQLTGDRKYADLGRRSFELALKGQRDRDDRYSWVAPGGALRAGPVLGWYAVGYDLCYDGWDEPTREKFGKAIENYDAGIEKRDARGNVTLETLVSGTMPPFSNHFGMQAGGAALALMAVSGEPWVNQQRIDSLLKISELSMIRNVTEGFGNGGFFAEGDGTGSMASHIVYLTAIQAWKNAMGMDFMNSGRPNVVMTALKWFYLTVIRDGKPDFWPIRGAYPNNVWDRKLSGAGYVGTGLGVVTNEQKQAIKWYYNHFLLPHDIKEGIAYDAGIYPHQAVSAFVNWPVDLEERNPGEVLSHCYRDSTFGFYAWRNRWQDENDIVMSVLTKPAKGYMGAKADSSVQIAAFGRKFSWGKIPGEVKFWDSSEKGKTSTMTFADGTTIIVDFTGASGADALLLTTGEAEGRKVTSGDVVVTIMFLTQGKEPLVKVRKNSIFIGKQIINVMNGNIALHTNT